MDILLLHYTGMRSGRAALERLCDASAKVSAHYMIDEDGTVYRLVDEGRRAWHAGLGYWAGERDINSRSIGIELVNPGHECGYRAFPEPQMVALIALAREIVGRHGIAPERVLGHSDVSPLRKADPGELFDWSRLAHLGLGLWPAPAAPRETSVGEVQRLLRRYGYEAPDSGRLDADTERVVMAFQRHFRPDCVDGVPDAETVARLDGLLARLG